MATRSIGSRRAASTLVALLIAGLGTFAVARYVGGLEAEATEGAELVEVFVSDGLIPAGIEADAVISAGFVEKTEVLARSLPEGAVGALDDISGLVALSEILPGEILLHARWGLPEELAGAFDIPDGMHAMSVEVDVPLGVANIISPGNRVSLIAHVERDRDDAQATGGSEALGVSASSLDRVTVQPGVVVEFAGGWSQYFLQDIEVLAIGERVYEMEEDGSGEAQLQPSSGSVMMTLAVTPAQAERLALAIFEADIYATLLPDGAEASSTDGVTLADLFR